MDTNANFDIEKYRSIGIVGSNAGRSRVGIHRAEGATVIEREHSDGRTDVEVVPDTVRLVAETHRGVGPNKGKVAEIREATAAERRDRYGE